MFGWRRKQAAFEPALWSALDRRDGPGLLSLIQTHGADSVDRDGRTALINAASRGDLELVRMALGAGCDIDAADTRGLTSLHFAVINSDLDLATLLLASGASVDPLDSWGNTPLNRAVPLPGKDQAADIVTLLVGHGADAEAANNHGVSPSSWVTDDPGLALLLAGS